jgi:hypothetical protein
MEMSTQAKTDEDSVVRMRKVSVSRYPGREPVTVRTTRVPGDDPSHEERIRAGLRRMLLEGRISLLD